MDFSAFAAVESSRARQQEERQGRFDIHYQEALGYLLRFQEQNCFYQPFLQKAIHELLAAVPHQRNRVEAYAWLAYAMYILENEKLFQNYFQIACSLDPDFGLVHALKNVNSEAVSVAFQPQMRQKPMPEQAVKKKPMVLGREKTEPKPYLKANEVDSSIGEASESEDVFAEDFALQDI